ncbi:related to flavin-binding monooxygenase [Cephalotrichum gorgonifer]|uniref:Related to flavin-binding monooxygenase n=1 Tax=Cephalotrichum gorgonifer TaxID=2041049 RepID=A0AAE8N7W7_9PEZI|nr:related to flavin-binding monooxygenase [Cephalotrichum gorgonifer]
MSEFPPAASLPKLSLCGTPRPDKSAAARIVNTWLATLQQRIQSDDLANISDLFVEEAYWRDIISLSWDFHTKSGLAAIAAYLRESSSGFGQLKAVETGGLVPELVKEYGLEFIQSAFTFETRAGRGRGVVRLANSGPSEWKAWTVSTQLEELNSKDASNGQSQANGVTNGDAPVNGDAATNGHAQEAADPQVIIVGAGQSGLGVAAHLKHLGVSCLIIERGPAVAYSWRQRYETVKTHTIMNGDHLPFMKYPSNWPASQDKSHILRWMDNYATIMGIEVQLNTTATKADYDTATRKWSLHITDKDGSRVLHANHVVMALGMTTHVPYGPEFPGKDSFKGHAYHAAAHKTAGDIPDLDKKNVVVVGCATTAHDMAQDFVGHGAKSVAMIQRQPTWSFSNEAIRKYHLAEFTTPGVSTEEADLLINSFPVPVARVFGYEMTQEMIRHDADMLDALEKAGLDVKRGEDGTSFIDYLFFKGGHFYVDQGATPMILDGRIKIHMCEDGVKEFYPGGLVLGDGREIEADVVVMATGFEMASMQLEKLMGEKIWQKASQFGMFDEEFERHGWWRPTGIPGFWYMCGTLAWSRQFSAVLALEIAAVERGFVDGYWEN